MESEPAPTSYDWSAPADGSAHDEPKAKRGVDQTKLIEFDHDKPRPFSLTEFSNHIAFVQAARPKGGKMERVAESDFSSKFK